MGCWISISWRGEIKGQFAWWHLRADTSFAPSQWETELLCNNVSHWLGASLKSTLTSKFAIIAGNLLVTCGFPSQKDSNLWHFKVCFLLTWTTSDTQPLVVWCAMMSLRHLQYISMKLCISWIWKPKMQFGWMLKRLSYFTVCVPVMYVV